MKVETLNDLMVEELKDVYHAEKQLVKALPKMAKSAESEELKAAFQQHLEETKGQVTRLEQVFEQLGAKAKAKPCAGMLGLIEEGTEMIAQDAEGPVYDLGLTGAALRVEHYEIAAYNALIGMAETLGQQEVVDLLQENLAEEEATKDKLMEMSKEMVAEAPTADDEYNDEEESTEIDEEEEDEEVSVS
jgi:ferritin-like metal-binding protein YciE